MAETIKHRPEVDLSSISFDAMGDVRRAADGEFTLLVVKEGGIRLKNFVDQAGGSLQFSFDEDDSGNSYYEWKDAIKELKQNVDLIVYDKESRCFYKGNGIRRLLMLPDRGGAYAEAKDRKDVYNFSRGRVRGLERFPIFISSTSPTRVLATGDRVVYRNSSLKF